MNNALEVRNLCKTYNDFSLDSISFTLPAGYIMGFVGQNGAGKTTTIRLILNMANRTGGEVKIYGSDNIEDELTAKQELAAVFDEIFFVDVWRIREIEKIVKGFYSKWDSGQFAAYMKKFKLSPDKKVKDLSRGMKLKLMLAVAMSHNAKLLILDEPTSGLDPVARDELLDILREYISDGEKSVFFSTHITSDLEKVADYITLIDNGKVFFTGTKDDLEAYFLIVKGGADDLTDALKSQLIGLSSNAAGFSGLLLSSKSEMLSDRLVTETPTIDEILVRISKGGGSK
ncbi:ABC transporter ATP-binding protein [Ruminiclostridium cellobioparum]|uniref:ABC-type multidrug transport system, ATPase component n=1 Tax=Ruminiclostridium cellobioparum subsp. termitidis CT1112 TaxID=1195236 RepID=S0FU97_RUMCE|nr:ABC transporter ATP-binding protein [Ruminiclostridium cellobioparum]EMS72093.1 ABC-type multidrug transport system, ATPase component [Ruminiclostridium cellobioparum subsp. termitidis CT1112]